MSKHERYVEVCKQMELLSIQDVTTNRQHRNGTRVWRLPIKYSTHPRFIEVASFKSGYVRNQNGGYTNYQLNKRCESEPEYYPDYKWCNIKNMSVKTGKYNMHKTRACVLIPNEIDRLEYLIAYCLKNYYIKNANQVVNGSYVPKWKYDEVTRWKQQDCGHYDRIKELEDRIYELESQVEVADNKLSNAISPTKYESVKRELAATKVRQDVSVIVNGHRYKVL